MGEQVGVRTCETKDCENVPYGTDKLCTPCGLRRYYSDKPPGHDFGD